MAPSDGDDFDVNDNLENNELNSDLKNSDVFKCCGKKATSIVCKRCLGIFHPSCVNRTSKIKRSEGGTIIVCAECDDRTPNPNEIVSYKYQIDYLKNELLLKNRIIKEMEDKNNLLCENILILKENNGLLVEKMQRMHLDMSVNKPEKRNVLKSQQQQQTISNQAVPTNQGQDQNAIPNTASYSGALKIAPALRNHRNLHLNIAPHSSHDAEHSPNAQTADNLNIRPDNAINKEQQQSQQTDKSENDFIYPRRRFKKRLGNAQPPTNSNFVGGDRKVWLYLYRVKRECDENAILRYIKTKDGFENLLVTVRELPTDQNKLKCFVVTAPLQKKDTMYDPDFWPSFVGVKRFDFERHRAFLNTTGGDFLVGT